MTVCGRGSGRHILLWSLIPLMSLLCWEAAVNAQCTRFEFPTARHTDDTTKEPIVETTENQMANIVFNIDIHNCGDTAQVSVTISKMNQTTEFYDDFCKLLVKSGKADVFYQEEKCRGGQSKGSYSLSKRVDRSDGTLWRWRASYKGHNSEQTVQMLVRYPPRITQLSKSFPSAAAKPGSSANLVCSYERGSPDVTPFLKDAQGRELRVHQGPGEVTHTIRDVKCNDTGRFRCEAPGATENKSLAFLVECPPQFREEAEIRKQFVVEANRPSTLTFRIRSHTAGLSACWLSPWPDSGRSSPQASERNRINCLSYVQTSGNPPDMILILRVPQMTSNNLGTWRLTIDNDAGSDDVIFGVQFRVVHGSSGTARTTVTPLDKTSLPPTTRGSFFVTSHHDSGEEIQQTSNEEEEESNSHILDVVIATIVIATIVVVTTCGAALGICAFFLFRRCKERFGSHYRLGRRRRDVIDQQQLGEEGQELMHLQPTTSNRTSPEFGEGGSAGYQMLQRPSPLPRNKPPAYCTPPPPTPAFSS